MGKRKANDQASATGSNHIAVTKRVKGEDAPKQAVARKNLLVDSDSEDEEAAPIENTLKVNDEFAKRFEYNKKREELSRLEEKFNNEKKKNLQKGQYGDKYDEDEDSSDEDEDDEGFLATEDLDQEISATLAAIRNKDPRVYDEKITFYAPIEGTLPKDDDKPKAEKPMYLRDYHRENLLKQANGEDVDADMEDAPPMTFADEQEKLKKTVLKEMHDAVSEGSEDEDGGFLIPKSKPITEAAPEKSKVHPSRRQKINLDVKEADKDPETFLSNFMAARAWVAEEGTKWEPMESEDEEEVERADKFEAAYNLRFEDPAKSNEVLKSYARDIIAEKSVRREEPKARKKTRDAEREKKDAEKRQREEEKARLRKLKIEQMEEKLAKIKTAAGLSGRNLNPDAWAQFLDEEMDDEKWEREMAKKFGEDYYAEGEAGSGSDGEDGGKKKKVKKPKWDDDIDIKDIIPDFVDELEEVDKAFSLSTDEAQAGDEIEGSDDDETGAKKKKSSKDRKSELSAKKKAARLERKKIEELVDAKLDVNHAILPTKGKTKSVFRYRETSPTSFGFNARDILMADDTALNNFVGLKKMATFRDAEKKRKDKKRLGKKARLREWRKETFGNEDGPEVVVGEFAPGQGPKTDGLNIIEGKKKKKRSRTKKNGEDLI